MPKIYIMLYPECEEPEIEKSRAEAYKTAQEFAEEHQEGTLTVSEYDYDTDKVELLCAVGDGDYQEFVKE